MHNGVRCVYPRSSKYLHDQIINLQAGINREFQKRTEGRLFDTKLLGKCGVFWGEMSAEVEAFHINLVTITYGE